MTGHFTDDTERIQGHPSEDVHEGERFMKSPLSGNWYRVTRWVDKGDGKAVALSKEQVDECDVPTGDDE